MNYHYNKLFISTMLRNWLCLSMLLAIMLSSVSCSFEWETLLSNTTTTGTTGNGTSTSTTGTTGTTTGSSSHNCTSLTSCSECSNDDKCVWCETNSICYNGDWLGPEQKDICKSDWYVLIQQSYCDLSGNRRWKQCKVEQYYIFYACGGGLGLIVLILVIM